MTKEQTLYENFGDMRLVRDDAVYYRMLDCVDAMEQYATQLTTSLTTRIEELERQNAELKKDIKMYQNRYEQSEGDKMLGY